MAKPILTDHRYDWRGGRNTAISPDLLNENELVDTTNIRLSTSFGGFTKRTGSQRMHSTSFGASIDGVCQWDGPNGKQTVVISGNKLWYRNGYDYNTGFTSVAPTVPGTTRSTNNGTDAAKAWNGAATSNSISRTTPGVSTVAAGTRIYCKLGDPDQTEGSNIPSNDGTYTLTQYQLTIDTTGITGTGGYFSASLTWEYSTDSGANWTPASVAQQSVSTSTVGITLSNTFGPITFTIPGAPAHVWIRAVLSVGAQYTGWSGTVAASMTVNLSGTISTFSWVTGAGAAQLGSPVTFEPFRDNTAGAPLVLYIASNNHYWKWDGTATLTLLDPTLSAPAALTIKPYHTRMFAVTSALPKTLFWSKIGAAADFATGDKTKGGSALADYLTGNALIAMEVIGSSLLLCTNEAIARFTGHASDDIVISQDTEGISTEVGVVGPLAIKRYENVAGFLSNRGPYAATEVSVQPIGEQLNPDWFALDNANIANSLVAYHRGRKELMFAVPRSTDGGKNKSIFVQSVRLGAWQGPWTYPFDITCMAQYVDITGTPNVIAGSSDGFIRTMDYQNPSTKTVADDVLYDGTGGTNITWTIELPVIHFSIPAIKKALKWMLMQADLPIGSNLNVKVAFDGSGFTSFPVTANANGEQDYRVDIAGDSSQGFRPRIQLTDNSAYVQTIYGISTYAWNYQRTS